MYNCDNGFSKICVPLLYLTTENGKQTDKCA